MGQDETEPTGRSAEAVARRFGLAFIVLGFAVAHWLWPAGITDLELAAIPAGQFLRALGSALFALAGMVLAVLFWT